MAAHLALALQALLVAGLLTALHRLYKQDYLRFWLLSWWSLAIHVAAGAASFYLIFSAGPGSSARLLTTGVFVVAGLWQAAWLYLGAHALTGGRTPERSRILWLFAALALFGVVATLLFRAPEQTAPRYFARFVLPGVFMGAAFLLAAYRLFQDRAVRSNAGFAIGAATLVIFGIRYFYSAGAWVVHVTGGSPGSSDYSFIVALSMEFVAFLLQMMMGLGMAVGLLMQERRRVVEVGVGRDSAQRALGQSRQRLTALFMHSRDGILILDDDRKIVDANPAAATLAGVEADRIAGLDMQDLVSPDVAEEAERGWGEILSRGRVAGEHNITTAGRCWWVEYEGVANIAPGLHMLVYRDVTERKELESQLHQSQKLESVGRLAGGVAHDFNNMLTAIMGYTQLILDDPGDEEATRSHIHEVMRSAERAGDLTRKLLAFSRRHTVERVPLDLGEAISNMENLLQRLIGEHIELSTSTAGDLPAALADCAQIEQIVLNLAVNARDAMPQGGKLIIETDSSSPDTLDREVDGDGSGERVRLSVIDSGIGMGPEVLEHLFEPFFTTKEVDRGTGLGLSTVYGIVKQSGGSIDVSSAVGGGTRFDVYFPAVEEPAVKRASAEQRAPAWSGEGTVLLVEDDHTVLELAREMLASQGFDVLSANHPETALTMARDHSRPLRLLMTDVVMPGMTGPQLAAQLEDNHPELPVLYVSGYTDDVISDLARIDQDAHFLQKPYTLTSLTEKLQQVLAE